jgi:hypothetical protein
VNQAVAQVAARDALGDALEANRQHILGKFRGQIYISNQLDVQTGRLWDSLSFEAGDELVRAEWFSNPNGKTLLDTNVFQSRQLDAPEAFSAERVVITFAQSAAPEDVAAIQDGAWFRFWLGCKYYLWSPIGHMTTTKEPMSPIRICDFCKSVYVEQLQCPGCGARSFKLTSLGEPGQQFSMEVNPEIVIVNQISFYATLETNRPIKFKKPLKVWFHLEGLHARGGQ